jgi:hypothetical protein
MKVWIGVFVLSLLVPLGLVMATPADVPVSPLDPLTVGNQNVEVVGHVGGWADALFVKGRFAYVSFGPQLAILDISDPAAPTRVGYVLLRERVNEIYVAGDHAYVTFRLGGLAIVDVSNPARPVQVGAYALRGLVWDIVVDGNFAYLAAEQAGGALWIIDVSNPATPSLAGIYNTDGDANAVSASGNYVFLSTLRQGVVILDRTNPRLLTEVTTFTPRQPVYTLEASATLVYLGTAGGLQVLDVQVPSAPKEVSFLAVDVVPKRVAVAGPQVYIVRTDGTVRVVDISTPANPVQLGIFPANVTATGIAVVTPFAYVADQTNGLRIFDISNPSTPTQIGLGSFAAPNWVRALGVEGGYAYASSEEGFHVIDLSDPSIPTTVESLSRYAWARKILVDGNFAYLLMPYGLEILDISDPTTPVQVNSFNVPTGGSSLTVAGKHAYLNDTGICGRGGCYANGLWILDVSDPRQLRVVGYHPGRYSGPVANNYLYVPGPEGVRIFDVSDPAHLIPAGLIPVPSFTLQIVGERGYLNAQDGLRVLDLSDPVSPIDIAFYPQLMGSISIDGNYIYVLESAMFESDTLWVLDITEPTEPVTIGFFSLGSLPAETIGPVADDGLLYLYGFGLYVLQHAEPLSTMVTPGVSTSLIYPDMQGIETRLDVPAGAVTEPTLLRLTPTLARAGSMLSATGHAVKLDALREGQVIPEFTFDVPVTLAVQYTDVMANRVWDESALVWQWMDGEWQDATDTCAPPGTYQRDINQRLLLAPICKAGWFGLFGPPWQHHLPLVGQSATARSMSDESAAR